MTRRRITVLLPLVLVLAAASFALPGFSSATWTWHSENSATVAAASDWTPPAVTLDAPGSVLKDTVTLTARATDPESGVGEVTIEYRPSDGGTWLTVCEVTKAPYSCAWDTRSVDGSYDLRARATDKAGYSQVSTVVRTTVANSLVVALTPPAQAVRGTVELSTTLSNTGTTDYAVRVEYSRAGMGEWKSICTGLSSPSSCSWDTTKYANGRYDLRAVAVSDGTEWYSAVVTGVVVDNAPPLVSMNDPGSSLSGAATFTATATDADSGLAQVVIQYSIQQSGGAETYRDLCTTTSPPYACQYDTTTLPDGTYSFRAVGTDAAGNTTFSPAVTNRVVDNTVTSVSLANPGAHLSGAVPLSADASSTAGVTSVRLQYAPAGTTTWADICTDKELPFTCTWNTTAVPDGGYDLRAVLLDGRQRETVSPVVRGRGVDNHALQALDVQTTNANGGSRGTIEKGDTVTFTYSEQVSPASVSPGWTGDTMPVSVRVVSGTGNTGDTLEVVRDGSVVNLGTLALNEQYVQANRRRPSSLRR